MESTKEKLQECLKRISEKTNNGEFEKYSERQVSQELVKPILKGLGWDIENATEVFPEFPTNEFSKSKIDYALRVENTPKILIEVKPSALDEKAERQLKSYVLDFNEKNIICILTNGISWKLYIFCENNEEIDLVTQVLIAENQLDVATKYFIDFLSKEKVKNGTALNDLRNLKKENLNLDEKEKESILINGWNSLFSNDFLQNKISELLSGEILLNKGFSLDEELLKKFVDNKLKDSKPSLENIPYKSLFKGNLNISTYPQSRKVFIHTSNEILEFKTMKEAISDFVKDISFINPEVLETYYTSAHNHGNKHKYITKTFDEATTKRNLGEANGWYINVDLSNQQVFDYIWKPLGDLLGKTIKFI